MFPKLGSVWRSPRLGAAPSGRPCTACRRSAQLRSGLWVASGFGRQGMNTSAMAGQLIARSILWGDERWRLFSPFELVWAGGPTGRVAGYFIGVWGRGSAAAAGALARHRERARARGTNPRSTAGRSQPQGRNACAAAPSAAGTSASAPSAAAGFRAGQFGGWRGGGLIWRFSQESEKFPAASVVTSDRRGRNSGRNLPKHASHGDHHDRPPYFARIRGQSARPCRLPVAAGSPAQAAEKFEVEKTDAGMACATDAAAI